MVQHNDPKVNGSFTYEISGGQEHGGLNVINMTLPIDDESAQAVRPGGNVPQGSNDGNDHTLVYVLIPLGALVLIAVLSFLVIFILKKSKLDRLRHHLMPLYNFDPMEEGGDWESELLEEDKDQQVALHIGAVSPDGPKLKFHTEQYEI